MKNNWRNEPATAKQLLLILDMQEHSPFIPDFKGKTKGEASDYINKWFAISHENFLPGDDYGDNEW